MNHRDSVSWVWDQILAEALTSFPAFHTFNDLTEVLRLRCKSSFALSLFHSSSVVFSLSTEHFCLLPLLFVFSVSVGYEYESCASLILWEKRTVMLQGYELDPTSLGGWSLDKHHILNTRSGTTLTHSLNTKWGCTLGVVAQSLLQDWIQIFYLAVFVAMLNFFRAGVLHLLCHHNFFCFI